jgi:predicted RNA-binding protein with RPS1 domain
MKDLTPSAWETFVATHRPGDVVRGKVTRFTNFGVFVELGEGLEGLCHISELSDERVEKPEDVAQMGQEMDFKVLRIEPADQKIGLSHRAVGKNDEPATSDSGTGTGTGTRMFSSEAKGGMASLGELANLKLGSAAAAEPAPPEPSKKQKRAKAAETEATADSTVEPSAEENAAAPGADETPEQTVPETPDTPASEAPAEEAPAPEASPEQPAEDTPAAETSESPAAESAEASDGQESPVAEIAEPETPPSDEPKSESESA